MQSQISIPNKGRNGALTNSEELQVEGLVKQLLDLGARKPLTRVEVAQSKKLMITLKEGGYTNEEISKLTRGAWAESTVKLYTRGVKVLDTSEKDQLASAILELVFIREKWPVDMV